MTEAAAEAALARLRRGTVPPATRLLGAEPLSVDPAAGTARVAFTAGPLLCNQHGIVHGGFQAAMMDEAMAIAAVVMRDFTAAVPTLEMKVSYLRPAKAGRLIAEGRVVRAGRARAFLAAELYDAEGVLAATASATAVFREFSRDGGMG